MKIIRDEEGRIVQIIKEEADGDISVIDAFKIEADKEIAKEKEITAQQKNRCDFWKNSIPNITNSIAEPPIMGSSEEKQPHQRTGFYSSTGKPCSLAGLKFSESFMERFKNKNLNDPEVEKEFKNYFHEIFMDSFKRRIGGAISDTAVAEAEGSFESLFKILIRILKETEE